MNPIEKFGSPAAQTQQHERNTENVEHTLQPDPTMQS